MKLSLFASISLHFGVFQVVCMLKSLLNSVALEFDLRTRVQKDRHLRQKDRRISQYRAMGDPGFIPAAIGFGVSKSIEMLIEVVNSASKCSERCTELKEKLDKVLPRVRHVEEQIASERMRYEGPVREWLDCLKAVADEANIAVQKSNSKSFWLFETAGLSRKLKELHARMEKLGEKDLDFSLHFQTHEQLVRIQDSVARIQSHQSPASSSQPYVASQNHMYGSYSLNYTVQGHQHMYNSGSHSEFKVEAANPVTQLNRHL